MGCSPSALCGGGDAGKGIFIYRNAAGTGTNTFNSAKMHWLYGTDGVADADIVRIKIFALEMVYIPAGSFYVGDGLTDVAQLRWADGTAGGVQITSALGAAFNGSSSTNAYDDTYMLQGAGARVMGKGFGWMGMAAFRRRPGRPNAAFPTGSMPFIS